MRFPDFVLPVSREYELQTALILFRSCTVESREPIASIGLAGHAVVAREEYYCTDEQSSSGQADCFHTHAPSFFSPRATVLRLPSGKGRCNFNVS